MRKLALTVVALTALTGGFLGCGGGSTRKPATGGAGTGGAGTTGAAGTGAAGIGAAGTGAAGTGGAGMGAAGTGAAGDADGGAAGTGAAGMDAAVELPPPEPPYCDKPGMVKKALPYTIDTDFQYLDVLHAFSATDSQWKVVANPNCDVDPTTLPALYTAPPPPETTDAATDGDSDGGVADAAAEGGTDAADAAVALDADAGATDAAAEAGTDAAAEAGTDAAASDAAKDAVVAETSSDAGETAAKPACFAFTYTPDPCLVANPANGLGSCWAGVVFEPVANAGMQRGGPGICVADGATTISFKAKGSRAGARIKWGSTREGLDTTEHFLTTLTKDWVTYTITIPDGELYNTYATPGGVWNGFSVVAEPADHLGGTYIFVKDIVWSKP